MSESTAPVEKKSVAQKLREEAEERITKIRETVGPMIAEEHELVSMVGQTAQFGEHKEEVVAPAPEPEKPAAASSSGETPKATRKRREGTRADQTVTFLEEHPGSTPGDIAAAMEIKPNYLYRVLGGLEKEGRVSKDKDGKYSVSA